MVNASVRAPLIRSLFEALMPLPCHWEASGVVPPAVTDNVTVRPAYATTDDGRSVRITGGPLRTVSCAGNSIGSGAVTEPYSLVTVTRYCVRFCATVRLFRTNV